MKRPVYVYTYVLVYIYIYIYMSVCVYIYMCVWLCVSMCVCVWVCVCVCVCVCTWYGSMYMMSHDVSINSCSNLKCEFFKLKQRKNFRNFSLPLRST